MNSELANAGNSEPLLGVIMPVFNESSAIDVIMPRVLAQSCVREVLVVDDGSTDRSFAKLEAWAKRDGRIRLFGHQKNRGKGAAIRTALAWLVAPVAVIQDGDMEYDPEDYGRMLDLIRSGEAEVVYGSRFLARRRGVNPFWHTLGNRALTWLANVACNVKLTDEATCYKMFRRDVLARIVLEEDGFGFCPEITAKISRLGIRIREVPIQYRGRTLAEGKKIRLRHGLEAIWCIVKYNLKKTSKLNNTGESQAARGCGRNAGKR